VVTVHRAFGFHVHVFGQGGEAKIELLDGGSVRLAWVNRVSPADLRRLMTEAQARHALLLRAWRTIHD